jgi:hypothetical protein
MKTITLGTLVKTLHQVDVFHFLFGQYQIVVAVVSFSQRRFRVDHKKANKETIFVARCGNSFCAHHALSGKYLLRNLLNLLNRPHLSPRHPSKSSLSPMDAQQTPMSPPHKP